MNLSANAISWSLNHLRKIGDSDLFPWAAEIEALSALEKDVIALFAARPISEFKPGSARRFMVPKDEISFRRATQLNPLDSLILTSLVYENGNNIESRRIPIDQKVVFSSRFAPHADGWLYDKNQDWTPFWKECHKRAGTCGHALVLDISDFYNQIYHHTIENQLIESHIPNQAVKWILGLFEHLTAKVSRGVPVGPHAVHLIAEASLIPFDNALLSRGISFIRYVDDIVVFGKDQSECQKHLYAIADALDKQQRLILNKSKTQFLTPEQMRSHAASMIEDRPISRTESDLLTIIRKYSGGSPYVTVMLSKISPEDLALFDKGAIEQILSEYGAQKPIDFIRLRWFLRRITQIGHPGGLEFCLKQLDQLFPALSSVCHYFLSVALSGTSDISKVADRLLKALETEFIKSNEYFALCILSLFARNGAFNHFPELINSFKIGGSNVRREVILASRLGPHADWLRELKEEAMSMDEWNRSAFLFAAKNLPEEERNYYAKSWRTSSALEEILLKWVKS